MITLTRTEIKWILNMVRNDRENNKSLMEIPDQNYAAFHRLKYENMASLAEKLEKTLDNDVRRIAVRR